MSLTRTILLIFLGYVLILALILFSGGINKAKSSDPLDLGGRHLIAVEGYGARCVIMYNEDGMASAGSGALDCFWGLNYRGDWRRMKSEGRY